MPNSAQINIDVIDQSISAQDIVSGVSAYIGVFKRGPIGKSNEVFSSWTRFKKVYGGLVSWSDDPWIVRRALARGTKLRICGVRHFTDITDKESYDAVKATGVATKVYTLSTAPTSGQTVNFTIGAITVSQLFNTTAVNTLRLLAIKIMGEFPTKVASATVISSTKLNVSLYSGGATLSVTGGTVAETRATATVRILAIGNDGDTITIKSGGTVLATYTKLVGHTTLTQVTSAITALIEAGSGTHSNNATSSGNLATISAPVGSGASSNGMGLTVEFSGAMEGYIINSFSGGVTAVAYVAPVTAVAASRQINILAMGAVGDSIDILDENGDSLTEGPVVQTISESTNNLMATKIRAAINAATGTNGGYTASGGTNGVVITGPTSLGATLNGSNTAPVIDGAITCNYGGFAGGTTGVAEVLAVAEVKATCTLSLKTLGVTGNTFAIKLNDLITIGSFTKTNSETTLAALATALAATFGNGYTGVASGNQIVITAPTGSGATLNGLTPEVVLTGDLSGYLTTLFAGGISAVAANPTVSQGTLLGFVDSNGVVLFELTMKYPGLDYNNVVASVAPASNGQSDSFNLKVEMRGESDYTPEVWTNLKITGTPTVLESTYLDDVVRGSELVDVVYKNLSALTTPIVPVTNSQAYSGGTNGSTPVDSDYIGDSVALNGMHALDNYGDMMAIACGSQSDAVAIAGAAYADARKDLQYYHEFDDSYTTVSQINAAKDALNIDTPYIQFYVGGLNALDPLTNTRRNIRAIGDILGAQAFSETSKGAWWSFAGINRGKLFDAFDVVNNFASSSALPDVTDLSLLANHQINAVVNDNGTIYISGNFSGQRLSSQLSYNNIVRLIIHTKKTLRPLLKPFIEEPNDIPTWKRIYLTVKPSLDELVSKRGLFSYSWKGDQFADTLDDLKVNEATAVGQGKYRVLLFVKPINSLQDIGISIIITPSSVSFEDSLTLL
jgi:hypothetical protein